MSHSHFELSDGARVVLASLRKHAEKDTIVVDQHGDRWGDVYLDNAQPQGMSHSSYAGFISRLNILGLYRPIDGFAWGRVRLEAAVPDRSANDREQPPG